MSLLQHVHGESEQSQCVFKYDPLYWLAVIVDKRQLVMWETILCKEFEPLCLPQPIFVTDKNLR